MRWMFFLASLFSLTLFVCCGIPSQAIYESSYAFPLPYHLIISFYNVIACISFSIMMPGFTILTVPLPFLAGGTGLSIAAQPPPLSGHHITSRRRLPIKIDVAQGSTALPVPGVRPRELRIEHAA